MSGFEKSGVCSFNVWIFRLILNRAGFQEVGKEVVGVRELCLWLRFRLLSR